MAGMASNNQLAKHLGNPRSGLEEEANRSVGESSVSMYPSAWRQAGLQSAERRRKYPSSAYAQKGENI
jgi:hypothetical protein